MANVLPGAGLVHGQQANYTQMEIDERYREQSESPQLRQDRSGVYFEALSDDEKKRVASANRDIRKNIADDGKKVESLLQSSSDLSDPLLKQFFEGYVFAQMTQLAPEKISELGKMRTQFIKDYASRKLTGQRREQFYKTIALPMLEKIYTQSDFHPAVRLNAVYLLGMLDAQDYNRSPERMPTPSPEAFEILLTIFNDGDMPDYLKVGALAGIQRHVEFDRVIGNQISAEKKDAVSTQAANILASQAAGQADWQPELDYWLKRRAVQILGLLKNAQALETIVSALNDDQSSMWLRLDAVEAIGRLDLNGVGLENANAAILAVADFVAQGIRDEATWIQDQKDKLVFDNLLFQDSDLEASGTDWQSDQPVGGGMGGDMFDPGMLMPDNFRMEPDLMDGFDMGRGAGFGAAATPQVPEKSVDLPNYQLNVCRRRIKALAFMGRTILRNAGLQGSADAPTKSFVDSFVKELDRVLKESNMGIVNLDEMPAPVPGAPEKPLAAGMTDDLMELCRVSGDRLLQAVRNQKGDDQPADIEAAGQNPRARNATNTAPVATEEQPLFGGN